MSAIIECLGQQATLSKTGWLNDSPESARGINPDFPHAITVVLETSPTKKIAAVAARHWFGLVVEREK